MSMLLSDSAIPGGSGPGGSGPAGAVVGVGQYGGQSGGQSASLFAARWAALHEAAAVVSALAGLIPPEPEAPIRAFPAVVAAAGGWRRNLAAQGIDDLTAILQTGITALLAVHARGLPAAAAARALWDEFVAARDGLVALCPADGQRRAII